MSNDKKRGSIRDNFWMLRRVFGYTPAYITVMVLEALIGGFADSVNIIYVKRLLDSLSDKTDFSSILKIIGAFAVYNLAIGFFRLWYWQVFIPLQHEKLHRELHCDLFSHAVRLDLAKYDDPEFYNDFIWSMEQAYNHTTGLVEDTGRIIGRFVSTFAVTGVLLSVNKLMAAVIFVLSAVRVAVTMKFNKLWLAREEECNPLYRKDGYIKRVFMLPDYAKELRATAVSECLFEDYEKNTNRKNEIVDKYSTRLISLGATLDTLMQFGESGILLLMLYQVMVSGTSTLGGFSVAVSAVWRMSWTLKDLVDRIMKYHEHGIFISKMINFVGCKPLITDGKETAGRLEEICLVNLCFSYGNGSEALREVNMTVKRGEKIAVVGYNGAGKTTLTKLLLRLYDSTDGQVLYNGKNIKEYTVQSIRKRVAAVFQDYRIFAASLAENVAGGEYSDENENAVVVALEKTTFGNKLSHLPNGIQTQLTREFQDDGTALSGGEQQKVAIARAFYKDADLIILDEPSSALDPDAEYELNRAITHYAEDKTVIFISHRLSTTRHADRIYMFDGGRLAECGTHEELIKQNGKYAYMFNLQAKKYRKQD